MQQFAKDMGFGICVCRAYRPQTKGKVESLAKLVDRLVVFNREFDTMDDLIVPLALLYSQISVLFSVWLV